MSSRIEPKPATANPPRVPSTLSAADLKRYSRHLALTEVGEQGQERLKAARVLIIGAGGLGSPAALYLAAAGVGTLGVVDFDRVDESNLQRQVLFQSSDIGAPKAEAARNRLAALNPLIDVLAHQTELHAGNVCAVLRGYDIVIDGSDRIGTRYLVNDACVLMKKPLISAAIYRFEGQALTYVPDRGPCYRCAFPSAGDAPVPNCADVGVLGVLPGVLGSIQATEAVKLIIGIGESLVGRLLTYDALELRFNEYRVERRIDCAVCGNAPSITHPQDPPGFCTLEEQRAVHSISAEDLHELLRQSTGLAVIDVREPEEFARGHLPEARNLPLSRLLQSTTALPPTGPMVFVCQTGVRSTTAAVLARRAGIHNVLQLAGGMKAAGPTG